MFGQVGNSMDFFSASSALVVYQLSARLRFGVEAVLSTHDLSSGGTIFNHAFTDRAFRRALFGRSHSSASGFFA